MSDTPADTPAVTHTPRHPGGRPPTYSQEDRAILLHKLMEYIEITDMPILAYFAYTHEIPRETLNTWEEFTPIIKRLSDKKEAYLEQGMIDGKINVTGSIFSLKQLGWSDRQQVDVTLPDGAIRKAKERLKAKGK